MGVKVRTYEEILDIARNYTRPIEWMNADWNSYHIAVKKKWTRLIYEELNWKVINRYDFKDVEYPQELKLEEVSKKHIIDVFKRYHYNRTHAALALGIGIRTLQRKLAAYGLSYVYDDEDYDRFMKADGNADKGGS